MSSKKKAMPETWANWECDSACVCVKQCVCACVKQCVIVFEEKIKFLDHHNRVVSHSLSQFLGLLFYACETHIHTHTHTNTLTFLRANCTLSLFFKVAPHCNRHLCIFSQFFYLSARTIFQCITTYLDKVERWSHHNKLEMLLKSTSKIIFHFEVFISSNTQKNTALKTVKVWNSIETGQQCNVKLIIKYTINNSGSNWAPLCKESHKLIRPFFWFCHLVK